MSNKRREENKNSAQQSYFVVNSVFHLIRWSFTHFFFFLSFIFRSRWFCWLLLLLFLVFVKIKQLNKKINAKPLSSSNEYEAPFIWIVHVRWPKMIFLLLHSLHDGKYSSFTLFTCTLHTQHYIGVYVFVCVYNPFRMKCNTFLSTIYTQNENEEKKQKKKKSTMIMRLITINGDKKKSMKDMSTKNENYAHVYWLFFV